MDDPGLYDYFGLDPETLDDPHGWFAAVRTRSRVWQEPSSGTWVVTGHDDIVAVDRDPIVFSSTLATVGPSGVPLASFGATPADRARVAMTVPVDDGGTRGDLVRLDPPEHTRLRVLVNRLFSPRRMSELEPGIRRLADDLVSATIERGDSDFLAAVARPLTFLTICDLLGIPEVDRATLLGLSSIAEKQGAPDGRDVHRLRHGTQRPFFERYIEDRRVTPADDHLSELANATDRDGRLPAAEDVATLAVTIFGAGLETTMRTLGTMVHHLAGHPMLADRLRREPRMIPRFIEEHMRQRSSVRGVFRYVTVDAELAGTTLSAGSILYLAYAAAGRDPDVRERPAEIDIDRDPGREHLNFGHGVHYCVGHALARLEIRICLEQLLARTAAIELLDETSRATPLPTFLLDVVRDVAVVLVPSQATSTDGSQ